MRVRLVPNCGEHELGLWAAASSGLKPSRAGLASPTIHNQPFPFGVLLAVALGASSSKALSVTWSHAEEWRSLATREEFRLRAPRPAVKRIVKAHCERADDDGIVVG
jgi:hypothetical protein